MHQGESARTLIVALGGFGVTMPGDCMYDVAGGRDYSGDSIGAWLQEAVGDYREIEYEGYSCAGRHDSEIRFVCDFV